MTSKGSFPAKCRLSNENIPTIICKFLDRPVNAIVTVDMQSLLEQTDSTVENRPKPSIRHIRLNINLTLVFRLCLLCALWVPGVGLMPGAWC